MNASSNTSSTASSAAHPPLRRTPLYDLHLAHGAKMVPFAGYEMPVQYAPGVLKEHLHTRQAAGLFDVSHMGQIALRPRSGIGEDAAAALERLVPADIVGLGAGRQRYTVLTNAHGGILDDLMVANLGDHLLLVVNAATKEADEAHLRAHLAATCAIEPAPERALLALQGPRAEAVLAAHDPAIAAMRFMDVRAARIAGVECLVSRSGYTGEDGFEIGALCRRGRGGGAHAAAARGGGADRARGARQPAARSRVVPLWIGSRSPTPIRSRPRSNGRSRKRAAPAAAAPAASRAPTSVLAALANGARRRRVGLRPEGRAPVRGGAQLYADADGAHAGRHRHLRRLRAELGGADRDGLRRARALRAGHAAVRRGSRRAPAGRWWHRCRSFRTPTSAADAPLPRSNPNSRAGEPAT